MLATTNTTVWLQLADFHVVCGLDLNDLCEAGGGCQVLEDVDIWSEAHHVLFSTSSWHANQSIQIRQCRAQNVTCKHPLSWTLSFVMWWV